MSAIAVACRDSPSHQMTHSIATGIFVTVCLGPVFVVPVLIAIALLTANGKDPLWRMAAFFILKPIVATPLWVAIPEWMGSFNQRGIHPGTLLGMLPGAILTLLIVWRFRSVFRGPERYKAWILLGLDGIRWANTLAISFASGLSQRWYPAGDYLSLILFWAALVIPTAYAVIALAIILWRPDQQLAPLSSAPAHAGQSLS